MTDNDRELIELAAKAAGIKLDDGKCGGSGHDGCFDMLGNAVLDWHNGKTWNPLTDDGDAFRLMVALQISVTPCFGSTYIDAGGRLDFSHIHSENETAISGARRAIVMMAAEIGRGMV